MATPILIDLSSETLDVDGNEHTFAQQLVLPAGGWDVEFFVQPIIPDDEPEDCYVLFTIAKDDPDAIVFANHGDLIGEMSMLPNEDGQWGDLSCWLRHKNSVLATHDDVARVHFNVYAPNEITFTISYTAVQNPSPPYTPALYPGFAHIRAESLG